MGYGTRITPAWILAVLLLVSGMATAKYSGGAGTEPNPYRIGNTADWETLSLTPEDWDSYFVLMGDINFGGGAMIPVGTEAQPFTGVFNGNGRAVRNGSIAWPESDYIGPFANLGAGCEIRNLGVEGVTVTGHSYVGGLAGCNQGGAITSCYTSSAVLGTGNSVGGLIGYNENGMVTFCHASGAVTGISTPSESWYVGGLVGWNTTHSTVSSSYATGAVTGSIFYSGGLVGYNTDESTLASCYATGQVITGDSYGGGLVGCSSHSTISACYATGAITGADEAGGLIGSDYRSVLSNCYASGSVSGSGYLGGLAGYISGSTVMHCHAGGVISGEYYVGGLVGRVGSGTVTFCYANGPVEGDEDVGGLAGCIGGGTVIYCFAGGAVTGTTNAGGLAGSIYGTVDYPTAVAHCYARGAVSGAYCLGGLVGYLQRYGSIGYSYATGAVSGDTDTGGLVGCGIGTVTSSYWDTMTTGEDSSEGGEGRATDDMTWPYGENTFTGWDFETVWSADTSGSINNGYPYLLDNVPNLPHPADINNDFRVALSEAIAYLTGWQAGSNPMAYAIRAAYLWQNGERYAYEPDEDPPVCWVLAP
ncbi:MAG: The GLUG motif protein [Candidatus Hydrogenedentes bacterium ADurb.Bin101]|mgnify:CR=1 FL=1|nr:MAG: The GLUG motif protein [Candidatus Hydrogenedentes bacterium ADurb.Bin101]HOC68545.1 GLUG motif-containing protein [Candidatus Hydrogenedentota bacterium]